MSENHENLKFTRNAKRGERNIRLPVMLKNRWRCSKPEITVNVRCGDWFGHAGVKISLYCFAVSLLVQLLVISNTIISVPHIFILTTDSLK